MKATTSIAKNLKLLFRSKEAAYTIVFGPLLIILLVSFAFMGSSDELTVRVGVYAESHEGLAQDTIATLNQKNYLVNVYPDNETCVDSVSAGDTHACMAFGREKDDVTPVTFYLDFSRINLVYQILDDLSEEMELQADAMRKEFAGNALLRLETGAVLVEESLNNTKELSARFDRVSRDLSTAKDAVSRIPTEERNITDIRPLKGYQQGLAGHTKEVATEALEAIDDARDLVGDLESACTDCSEGMLNNIEQFEDRMDEAEETISYISSYTSPEMLDEALLTLRFAIDDLEHIKSAMENTTAAGRDISGGVSRATPMFEQGRTELNRISTRLEYTVGFLRGEEVDTEAMSAPIATNIVSVTASEDQLSFAYPYLLVLVIMFIGMLLSSMLVVTDKISLAAFRNFTTPTSDGYHVLLSFVTAFLILFAEVAIILLVSSLFVAQPLLLNPGGTFLIVSFAIIIFTFLGMIVGYLASRQEAAMITSISLGSVLLFVSNLVIPVEGMAGFARFLSAFNPYIVLSELLKKSMLHGVTLGEIARDVFVLGICIALLLILTIIVQRKIKKKYFRQDKPLLHKKRLLKPLQLGPRLVHNEMELMDALDSMTRDAFASVEENTISVWVEKELRNKRLSRQLRTKSKEKMILRLDTYLRKHGKHMKR